MDKILQFIGTLIGPDKVGSFVRGLVAGAIALAVSAFAPKWPFIADLLDPAAIDGIALTVGGAVAAVWAALVKKPVA
jgi:hypothetical protein